jgi:hypothetical protein
MYSDKPTRGQVADSLMHSSIDIDQMIIFEVENIEDSIPVGAGNIEAIAVSLLRIKSLTQENSTKVREARSLVRQMQ